MTIQYTGLEGYPSDWEWTKVKRYVQQSWLGRLLCVFPQEGVIIKRENPRNLPATKDITITRDIIKTGYTGKTLRLLNKVRMAKQLLWMSNMVTPQMDQINGRIIKTGVKKSIFKWPEPDLVSASIERLWRTCLGTFINTHQIETQQILTHT